jgi:hypothetical protein
MAEGLCKNFPRARHSLRKTAEGDKIEKDDNLEGPVRDGILKSVGV